MKKILLFTAVFFIGISSINAQEQAIKVNPIGLAFGVANAGYEFATNESQTLTIAGLYYNISDVSGFGAGVEYRFYFSSDEALNGWHAGPSLGYVSLEDDFNNSAGFFTVGGEVGHQWLIGEHFLVDVFAGLGYIAGSSDDLAVTLSSTAVSLGVSVGYAW
ncbi:hypothetical protein DIS18_10390 [Algibacter marinivivus]|uniref:DUF3575 domain-containing protein n=1 Tax=Algibacter marinivivus TaxID=2100723 RepID=A0A2U2X4C5_9FLAO|nr:DUF3575 domain-containing protein [Algibacter marinivivus]PWH82638.1 hypothetical protein DIS18_10390 [Algibacter marinivivus]